MSPWATGEVHAHAHVHVRCILSDVAFSKSVSGALATGQAAEVIQVSLLIRALTKSHLGNGEGGREAEFLRNRVMQRSKVAVAVPRSDERVALLGPAARLYYKSSE